MCNIYNDSFVHVSCVRFVYRSFLSCIVRLRFPYSSFVSFRSCIVRFSHRSFVSFAFFVRLRLVRIISLYDPGSVQTTGGINVIYKIYVNLLSI